MSGNISSKQEPPIGASPTTSRQEPEMSHEEFLLRDGRSIVNFLGPGVSECGYCKNESAGGRSSNNLIAFKLTAHDYQDLINRGWRRSGAFCYQPTNTKACCPNYSILCKVLEFKFSRSKRKCIQNLNNFLMTGILPGDSGAKDSNYRLNYNEYLKLEENTQNVSPTSSTSRSSSSCSSTTSSRFTRLTFDQLKESKKAKDKRFVRSCERKIKLYNVTPDQAVKRILDRPGRCKQGTPTIDATALEYYLYPHETFLHHQMKQETTKPSKRKSSKKSTIRTTETATTISGTKTNVADKDPAGDQSDDEPFKPKHKLEIKMLHVESAVSRALREEEHEILVKYQDKVHDESAAYWTMEKYCDFLVDTPLFAEPLDHKYDYLENDYPQDSPGDTFAKKAYKYKSESDYILVKPPHLPTAYGTYHCTYHLDGKLIACGVLDVIPESITTAYFFYDPKYSKLNLGIYSALVEISMIRQMAQQYRGDKPNILVDYNIGFYVHECPKMHYKATFEPSYLLCSETCRYEPTKECLKKLADTGKKYARFSPPDVPNAFDISPTMDDILKIPISVNVFNNKSLKLGDYFEWLKKNIGSEYIQAIIYNYLTPYVKSVGLDLLPNIILQIDRVHRGILSRYLIATEEKSRRAAAARDGAGGKKQ